MASLANAQAKTLYASLSSDYSDIVEPITSASLKNYTFQYNSSNDWSEVPFFLGAYPDYKLESDTLGSSDTSQMQRDVRFNNYSMGIAANEYSSSSFNGSLVFWRTGHLVLQTIAALAKDVETYTLKMMPVTL